MAEPHFVVLFTHRSGVWAAWTWTSLDADDLGRVERAIYDWRIERLRAILKDRIDEE